MNRIQKIVLVAHDNSGSRRLLEAILNSRKECQYLVVITRGLYYKKSFFASVIKLLREASLTFVILRFLELLVYTLRGDTIVRECRRRGIPIIFTKDINSERVLSALRDYQPDLMVSLYTMQIYRKDIIGVPRYGSITSHPSMLPDYRGLEVFFWVLVNDESETGVSVFYLTGKVDVGGVISQEIIPILDTYSVSDLYSIVTEVAGRLLVQAISDIDTNCVKTFKVSGEGSYYPMPTREAVSRFRKLGKRFF